MRQQLPLVAVIIVLMRTINQAGGQGVEAYEQSPVNYSTTEPRDAIAKLEARVAGGDLKWTSNGREIVQQLLKELQVPVESQMLVFSKTSFQRNSISPKHPRALYYSDTAYVGWLPGGLIEVATIDPQLGPVFYSFDPNTPEPRFVRDSACMTCHGGVFVRGIPGVFVRSIFTDATGEPLFRFGSEVVDFRTQFTNRWGGWYVTGKHGSALHRGNVLAQDKDGELVVNFKHGANKTSLADYFSTKPYLAAESDVAALLVFEHQTAMQNTLTRAMLDCRRMLAYQRNLQLELKETVTEGPAYDSVKHVFEGATQDIVDDLLFKGEAKLPAGLEGNASFQKVFRASAPRSAKGLSLKDFQLIDHLFNYRCSYLIYSEMFQALPGELKRRVYAKLIRALQPKDSDPRYAYLPTEERQAISTILLETHREFREAAQKQE